MAAAGLSVGQGGGGRSILTSRGGGKAPPSPSCDGAGDGTEGKGGSGRWDAGAELRCGRTAVAQGNAGPGGGGGRRSERASGSARAGPGVGGVPGTSLGLGGGRARTAGGGGGGGGCRGEGRTARMRAAPAPPGLVGPVRAHARCPPEASGCAERARAARRRTCEVSLEEREGGCAEPAAWGASTPHLE